MRDDCAHMTNQRIPSLDGLRALAILMVVVSHSNGAPGFANFSPSTSVLLGDTGVRIFFVISGFLITTLLVDERSRTGDIRLARFYTRRVFRIFPPFYFFLGGLAVGSRLGWIVLQKLDIVKAALYLVDYCPWDSTSNFVRHIWSLSVEEQFYLIWPLALWWGGGKARWSVVAGAVILSPVWRLVVLQFLPAEVLTIDRRFDCVADSLAVGCLLALLKERNYLSRYDKVIRSDWMHFAPLVVICAAATASHPHAYYGFFDSVTNVGIALYMYRCIICEPRLLNIGWVRQIGLMSYSIYLWQVFCSGQEGMRRLPSYYAIPITIAIAITSFYFVERPMQRFGRRIATRM